MKKLFFLMCLITFNCTLSIHAEVAPTKELSALDIKNFNNNNLTYSTEPNGQKTVTYKRQEGSAAKTIIDLCCFFTGLSYAFSTARNYYDGNNDIAQRSLIVTGACVGAWLLNHLIFTKIVLRDEIINMTYNQNNKLENPAPTQDK